MLGCEGRLYDSVAIPLTGSYRWPLVAGLDIVVVVVDDDAVGGNAAATGGVFDVGIAPIISVIVDCRAASSSGLPSLLSFFLVAVVPFNVTLLGSRGFLGLVTFGLPSSIGLPSGPSSFFFRCRFGLSTGADVMGLAVVTACRGCAGVAACAVTTPRFPTICKVSDSVLCGETGGDEMEDELSSDRGEFAASAMLR